MNTVRINGQDYTSSLSDTEIAFIGNLSLPTTAQTLSGAIAEHETDISELNSNITDIFSENVTKNDGGNYIHAEYSHTVFKLGKLKILQLSFELKAVSAGGSYKTIYTLPSGYYPSNTCSTFFVTAKNQSIQIRITTDGQISFYSVNAFTLAELVNVYFVYL